MKVQGLGQPSEHINFVMSEVRFVHTPINIFKLAVNPPFNAAEICEFPLHFSYCPVASPLISHLILQTTVRLIWILELKGGIYCGPS